ncbi:MAG: T9SS type A sorting domain-containing protein [Ignavibacteriota bacterium]
MKKFLAVSCVSLFVTINFITGTCFSQDIFRDVSNTALNQDNPSVSINRKNPNVIVIGAASDNTDMDNNGIPAYTSLDTGKTWSLYRLPLPTNHLDTYIYGEASLTCDNSGNYYYGYITNDGADSAGSIVIAKSTDGIHWSNGTPIDNNSKTGYEGAPDGVFLSVDNSASSLYQGRIYAVWNQFYAADSLYFDQGAYISWSDNQAQSWSKPVFVSASDDYQMVRIGKNGEVIVALTDSLALGSEIFISLNGGATFALANFQLFTNYPEVGVDGYTGLKGSSGFAAFPYPAIDVDIRSNRIYEVFGDYQGAVATQSVTYSDDLGAHWSTPQILGIEKLDSADRFDPSVSVDPVTGSTYLFYFSSEGDLKNELIAPTLVPIVNGVPATTQMLAPNFNPLLVEKTLTSLPYIGDRTASDAYAGIYAACWTQNRSGFTDADIFSFVSTPAGKAEVISIPTPSSSFRVSSPYPNPSMGVSVAIALSLPSAKLLRIAIYDLSGRELKLLTEGNEPAGASLKKFDLSFLNAGEYLLQLSSEDGTLRQKLVILR